MKKRFWLKLSFLFLLAVFLTVPFFGYAGVLTGMAAKIVSVLGHIVYYVFIYVMGWIGTIAMDLLIFIAGFTGFTNIPAVVGAWMIVRDMANTFFIVILLFIAFGTILKIEAYHWTKLLPKMIIAAVLINFSRTIAGIFVDASQIIMLTFLNAFKDAAQVNFATLFRLSDLTHLTAPGQVATITGTSAEESKFTNEQYLLAMIAASVMLSVLVFCLLLYATVLVLRLVFIWFLVVLSPLAYVTSVLPATQKYCQQWWSAFGRYIAVGPLMVFFLWLALYIGGGQAATEGIASQIESVASEETKQSGAVSEALQPQNIANFIIAVLMLLAGLKYAQEFSNEFAKITGTVGNIAKIAAGVTVGMAAFKTLSKAPKFAIGWTEKRWGWQKGIARGLLRTAPGKFYLSWLAGHARDEYHKKVHAKFLKRIHAEEQQEYERKRIDLPKGTYSVDYLRQERERQINEELSNMSHWNYNDYAYFSGNILQGLANKRGDPEMRDKFLGLIQKITQGFGDDLQDNAFFQNYLDTHGLRYEVGINKDGEEIKEQYLERNKKGQIVGLSEEGRAANVELQGIKRYKRHDENVRRFMQHFLGETIGDKEFTQEALKIANAAAADAVKNGRVDGLGWAIQEKDEEGRLLNEYRFARNLTETRTIQQSDMLDKMETRYRAKSFQDTTSDYDLLDAQGKVVRGKQREMNELSETARQGALFDRVRYTQGRTHTKMFRDDMYDGVNNTLDLTMTDIASLKRLHKTPGDFWVGLARYTRGKIFDVEKIKLEGGEIKIGDLLKKLGIEESEYKTQGEEARTATGYSEKRREEKVSPKGEEGKEEPRGRPEERAERVVERVEKKEMRVEGVSEDLRILFQRLNMNLEELTRAIKRKPERGKGGRR